jgi:diphthine-ammonia ligase
MADSVFLRESYKTILLGRSSRRQVLHVKGVSEWAPLCIGPYAQANVLNDCLIYASGQIPLNPASMDVWVPSEGTVHTYI